MKAATVQFYTKNRSTTKDEPKTYFIGAIIEDRGVRALWCRSSGSTRSKLLPLNNNAVPYKDRRMLAQYWVTAKIIAREVGNTVHIRSAHLPYVKSMSNQNMCSEHTLLPRQLLTPILSLANVVVRYGALADSPLREELLG